MTYINGLIHTTADSNISRPRYVEDSRVAPLNPEITLTRYLPHWKFYDMIGTNSLFFTRVTEYLKSDPDEGRIATSYYAADIHFSQHPQISSPEAYAQFISEGPHKQAYVSCWYSEATESERMWREYVPNGQGVAVQTTVGKLLAYFNGNDCIKIVTLAAIEYGNHSILKMPGLENNDDRIAALKYKGIKWQHEAEVRAIILYDMYYISSVLSIFGDRLAIDPNQLFDRIIISPAAPTQYKTHLEQISKRRSRPSSALYVLLYTAGRRLNGYDVRKSALNHFLKESALRTKIIDSTIPPFEDRAIT